RALRSGYLLPRGGRGVRATAHAAAARGAAAAGASRPAAGMGRGLPDPRQTLLARQFALARRSRDLQRERLREPWSRAPRHARDRAGLPARRAAVSAQLSDS